MTFRAGNKLFPWGRGIDQRRCGAAKKAFQCVPGNVRIEGCATHDIRVHGQAQIRQAHLRARAEASFSMSTHPSAKRNMERMGLRQRAEENIGIQQILHGTSSSARSISAWTKTSPAYALRTTGRPSLRPIFREPCPRCEPNFSRTASATNWAKGALPRPPRRADSSRSTKPTSSGKSSVVLI